MSSSTQKKHPIFLILLSLVALGVSCYLFMEYIHVHFSYTDGGGLCSISKTVNCATAAKSPYSIFLGVPISLWGLGLYTVMSLWFFKIYIRPEKYGHFTFIAFLIFLSSVVYSLLLGFLSIFVIKAICPFCFSLYFLNITMFLILFSMIRKTISLQKIKESIILQLFRKSTIAYLMLFASIIFTGEVYKKWWALNHSDSVLNYRSHEDKKVKFTSTSYKSSGNKEAKIRIDIFSDYQCPYCARAHHKISKALENHGDKILVYMHNFPLDRTCNPLMKERILHKDACSAAKLAIALENKGLSLKEENAELYKISLDKTNLNFLEKAKSLLIRNKIDLSVLQEMNSEKVREQLRKEITDGMKIGVKETPTIFIDGYPVPKIPSYEFLLKMLSLDK